MDAVFAALETQADLKAELEALKLEVRAAGPPKREAVSVAAAFKRIFEGTSWEDFQREHGSGAARLQPEFAQARAFFEADKAAEDAWWNASPERQVLRARLRSATSRLGSASARLRRARDAAEAAGADLDEAAQQPLFVAAAPAAAPAAPSPKRVRYTLEDRPAREDEEACGVCLDNVACVTNEACGHKALCGACVDRIEASAAHVCAHKCPLCRAALGALVIKV